MEETTALDIGFRASMIVGTGTRGEVILSDEDNTTLHKYRLTQGKYMQVFSRDLPQNISPRCRKAVSGSGLILLQEEEDSPTLFLSEDGSEVVRTLQHEGELITCLQPTRPVFAVRKDRGWAVVIVDNSSERTLQPASGRIWSWRLSVCQDDECERTAVTDYFNKTLSIFSGEVGKSPQTSSVDIIR